MNTTKIMILISTLLISLLFFGCSTMPTPPIATSTTIDCKNTVINNENNSYKDMFVIVSFAPENGSIINPFTNEIIMTDYDSPEYLWLFNTPMNGDIHAPVAIAKNGYPDNDSEVIIYETVKIFTDSMINNNFDINPNMITGALELNPIDPIGNPFLTIDYEPLIPIEYS